MRAAFAASNKVGLKDKYIVAIKALLAHLCNSHVHRRIITIAASYGTCGEGCGSNVQEPKGKAKPASMAAQ